MHHGRRRRLRVLGQLDRGGSNRYNHVTAGVPGRRGKNAGARAAEAAGEEAADGARDTLARGDGVHVGDMVVILLVVGVLAARRE